MSLAVGPGTDAALAAAEVVGSMRAGRLRLAFHLPNTEADADRAADVLTGRVR